MNKTLKKMEDEQIMTIEKFIKQLQCISEDKKKLPLVIYTPNRMECEPTIKMLLADSMINDEVEKMVITYY